MEYRDVLRLYMDERGETAGTLAKKIGCNRSTIYALLNGRAKDPTLATAKAIADAFGVTLQEMVDVMMEVER